MNIIGGYSTNKAGRGRIVFVRKVIRKVLTWVLAGCIGAIGVAVIGEWFIEVARAKGWYDDAGQRWDQLTGVMTAFATSGTVLYPVVALGGLVAGLWFDAVLVQREGVKAWLFDRNAPPNSDEVAGEGPVETNEAEALLWQLHPVTKGPAFVGLTRSGLAEPRVISIEAHATNNSGKTLDNISGYIQSYESQQSFTLFLIKDGRLVEPSKTFGIPEGVKFGLSAPLSGRDEIGEGVPAAQFLENFGGFELVLRFDGGSYTFSTTTEDCSKQIMAFRRQTGEALI